MSSTKIIQYVHRPNSTELGQANTHETYLLVDTKTDLSDVFPIGVETAVKDNKTGTVYDLKSSSGNGSEFRINQMGPIYRDYSVMPGDELTITHIETDDNTKNVITVKTFNRVVIIVDKKGAEIINIERLSNHLIGDREYSITVNYQGKDVVLNIAFLGLKKKRTDSPTETAFYSISCDNVPLSSNTYYLNIGDQNELVSGLKKSEYNKVVIENLDDTNIAISNYFKPLINQPLQQIFYGAPGTGKSHRVKEIIKEHGIDEKEQVIRTTFHPDSDYSTFVGCYKPIMKSVPQTYVVEGNEKPVMADKDNQATKDEIVYDYTPQAFVQAYTKAWTTDEPVILVIEEINRGNCAQIFGDIFQLLDRGNDNVSEYEIKPDKALENYLKEYFAAFDNMDEQIKSGKTMKLPANLYIWATMNTSDQSLFPIDSAFKRRWEWRYMKIVRPYKKNEDGSFKLNENGEKIPFDFKIEGDHDWWAFLQQINAIIDKMTNSADKQLGYFFAKAKDDIISYDTFVSKVCFYLWNDIFKTYALDEQQGDLFSYIIEEGKKEQLTFPAFYDGDGNVIPAVVEAFINNVMDWNNKNDKA